MINVYAQYFAQKRVDVLTIVWWVICRAAITRPRIKKTIGAKLYRPAIVVTCLWNAGMFNITISEFGSPTFGSDVT